MRFEYALVSSFLFVPAVLADLPGPKCRDRCLAPDFKGIPPLPLPTTGEYSMQAGAFWCTDDETKSVTTAIGTLMLPLPPYGAYRPGTYRLKVGLGGYKIDQPEELSGRTFQASVGVQMNVAEHEGDHIATYRAFGYCHSSPPMYADASYTINPTEDFRFYRASVHVFDGSRWAKLVLTKLGRSRDGWEYAVWSWEQILRCNPLTTTGLLYDAAWVVEKLGFDRYPYDRILIGQTKIRIHTINGQGRGVNSRLQSPPLEDMYEATAIREFEHRVTMTKVENIDEAGSDPTIDKSGGFVEIEWTFPY